MPLPQRYYYFDFIRASLMLLGIPFHAALIYLPGLEWNVISPDKNWIMQPIAGIIHSFRMQAFFLLSGFFSAMLLSRRERWAWLRSRYVRIGVPLLASALLLIPFQISLIRFFDEDAAAQPWITQYRLFHFWFLPALLLLCSLLALSWSFVVSKTFRSACHRLIHPAAPWILMVALIAWAILMSGFESASSLNLPFAKGVKILSDPLTYLPYFTIGVIFSIDDEVFDRFVRIDIAFMLIGAVSSIVFSFTWYDVDFFDRVISFISGPIAALFISLTLLAICRRYLDFNNSFSIMMSDASFTIYLLHQPVIILLGFLLLSVRAPTILEYVAICLITFAACLAAHLLLRRSAWLAFFFNGVVPKAGFFAKPRHDLVGGYQLLPAAAERSGVPRDEPRGNPEAAAGGGMSPLAATRRASHWRRKPSRDRRRPATGPAVRQE